VDVVVDNVGTTFMQSLRTLRKGRPPADGGQQRRSEVRDRQPLYVCQTSEHHRLDHEHLAEFNEVMDLVVAGKLKPIWIQPIP
jgi:hypothetical protein